MKVSPGCANCYAEAFSKRPIHVEESNKEPHALKVWGPMAAYKVFGEHVWNDPLRWNRKAFKNHRVDRVFCASMADVFDERGPESERQRLWNLIEATPNLTWQLLTKRPENWKRMLPAEIPPNMWLGFTAEDQEHYDKRIDAAMEMYPSSARLFVSYEPALGPIRLLRRGLTPNWMIFGGETGPARRPVEQKWAEDIKADCEGLGVAFFMKQMGGLTPARAKAAIPAHLNVQEFPDGAR